MDSAAMRRSRISGISGSNSSFSSCALPISDSSIAPTEANASSRREGAKGWPSFTDRKYNSATAIAGTTMVALPVSARPEDCGGRCGKPIWGPQVPPQGMSVRHEPDWSTQHGAPLELAETQGSEASHIALICDEVFVARVGKVGHCAPLSDAERRLCARSVVGKGVSRPHGFPRRVMMTSSPSSRFRRISLTLALNSLTL